MKFRGWKVSDDMLRVFEDALAHGWQFIGATKNGHFKFRHPETNTSVTACSGFGDKRSSRNTQAQFKRLGPAREPVEKEKAVPQVLEVVAEELPMVADLSKPQPRPLAPVSASTALPTIAEIDAFIDSLGKSERRNHLGVAMLILGIAPKEIATRLDVTSSFVYNLRKAIIEDRKYQAKFCTEEDFLAVHMKETTFSDGAKRFANRFAERYPNLLPEIQQVRKLEDTKLVEQAPRVEVEIAESPMEQLKRAKASYEQAVFDLLLAIDSVKKDGVEIIIERNNFDLKLKTRVIREEEI